MSYPEEADRFLLAEYAGEGVAQRLSCGDVGEGPTFTLPRPTRSSVARKGVFARVDLSRFQAFRPAGENAL